MANAGINLRDIFEDVSRSPALREIRQDLGRSARNIFEDVSRSPALREIGQDLGRGARDIYQDVRRSPVLREIGDDLGDVVRDVGREIGDEWQAITGRVEQGINEAIDRKAEQLYETYSKRAIQDAKCLVDSYKPWIYALYVLVGLAVVFAAASLLVSLSNRPHAPSRSNCC